MKRDEVWFEQEQAAVARLQEEAVTARELGDSALGDLYEHEPNEVPLKSDTRWAKAVEIVAGVQAAEAEARERKRAMLDALFGVKKRRQKPAGAAKPKAATSGGAAKTKAGKGGKGAKKGLPEKAPAADETPRVP